MLQRYRLLSFLLGAFSILLFFFFIYQAMLVPIMVGAFLAYLLLPVVDWFDIRTSINRSSVCLILVAAIVLTVTAVLFGVAPYLYEEIASLLAKAPTAYQTIIAEWVPYFEKISKKLGFVVNIREVIASFGSMEKLSSNAQQALQTIWFTAPKLIGAFVDIFLTPVIAFVLLRNASFYLEFVRKHVPTDLKKTLWSYFSQVDRTLRDVIKGHVIVASILAVLYCLGFSLVGLNGAIAIGLIGGFCRVVPYVDIIVGGSLSLVSIFSDFTGDWGLLIGVILVITIVQVIDGTLITPRVIGERVGLHPVVVIVSILALGQILGFWGVILAIPTVAMLKVTLKIFSDWYLKSGFFTISDSGEKEPQN